MIHSRLAMLLSYTIAVLSAASCEARRARPVAVDTMGMSEIALKRYARISRVALHTALVTEGYVHGGGYDLHLGPDGDDLLNSLLMASMGMGDAPGPVRVTLKGLQVRQGRLQPYSLTVGFGPSGIRPNSGVEDWLSSAKESSKVTVTDPRLARIRQLVVRTSREEEKLDAISIACPPSNVVLYAKAEDMIEWLYIFLGAKVRTVDGKPARQDITVRIDCRPGPPLVERFGSNELIDGRLLPVPDNKRRPGLPSWIEDGRKAPGPVPFKHRI